MRHSYVLDAPCIPPLPIRSRRDQFFLFILFYFFLLRWQLGAGCACCQRSGAAVWRAGCDAIYQRGGSSILDDLICSFYLFTLTLQIYVHMAATVAALDVVHTWELLRTPPLKYAAFTRNGKKISFFTGVGVGKPAKDYGAMGRRLASDAETAASAYAGLGVGPNRTNDPEAFPFLCDIYIYTYIYIWVSFLSVCCCSGAIAISFLLPFLSLFFFFNDGSLASLSLSFEVYLLLQIAHTHTHTLSRSLFSTMVRRIAFGTDHSAFPYYEELLLYIKAADPTVTILRFNKWEDVRARKACDYPSVARAVGEAVASGECDVGILICGTGIGMSLAANKVPGIRAALCHDVTTTRLARTHNNANVLCAGCRTCGVMAIEAMITVFLNVPFSEAERHSRRIARIEWMEERYMKEGRPKEMAQRYKRGIGHRSAAPFGWGSGENGIVHGTAGRNKLLTTTLPDTLLVCFSQLGFVFGFRNREHIVKHRHLVSLTHSSSSQKKTTTSTTKTFLIHPHNIYINPLSRTTRIYNATKDMGTQKRIGLLMRIHTLPSDGDDEACLMDGQGHPEKDRLLTKCSPSSSSSPPNRSILLIYI
eukprot:gene4723-3414_t